MSSRQVPTGNDERTAPARIRDAAIRRIAADGVERTTARAVATDAGVSPALVIHHYDSMDNLRRACDHHVVHLIRRAKTDAMTSGSMDPLAAARDGAIDLPVLAYLARTLTDGTPHVRELVAEMVDDAVEYLGAGQKSGMIGQVEDLRATATVLTIWSLGAVVLHDHVHALLGVDLLDPDVMVSRNAITRYQLPALDLLAGAFIPPDVARQVRAALARTEEPPTEETDS